ncbi:hypothetical protein ACQ858_22170 [Variovorax ureilyticus]|uniref:hypothetical protein n=1 Tax=Variovorax ureilyticus TaxID=1836198 RepID=UPI003D67FDAC
MVNISERNIAFVNFVHACLGHLSENVRRVDFRMISSRSYQIRVVVRHDSTKGRTLFKEVLEDFEATLGSPYGSAWEIDFRFLVEADELSVLPKDSGYLGVFREA